MIVDSSDNVLYYDRMKGISEETDAGGTQSIAIPAGLNAKTHTLKVFNEQYNGDSNTDYASAFEDATLTVTTPIAFNAPAAANGSDAASATALTLTFDKDVAGFSADDIIVTGTTKGTLYFAVFPQSQLSRRNAEAP